MTSYRCKGESASAAIQSEGSCARRLISLDGTPIQFSFTLLSRNIRGSPSSSVLFKSNYAYGLWTLVKFLFLTIVIGALSLSLTLSYNLYSRLELLQTNIDGCKSLYY